MEVPACASSAMVVSIAGEAIQNQVSEQAMVRVLYDRK